MSKKFLTSIDITGSATTSGDITSSKVVSSNTSTGTPTFTSYSSGTRFVLYDNVGASSAGYTLGIAPGVLWQGIPAVDAGMYFKWYAGQTEVASLSGTGNLIATGNMTGKVLVSSNSLTNEGGQIELSLPSSGSTLSGTNVTVDIYQDRIRFFESGGTNRGAYIDLSAATTGVGSNLLSGGSSWNGGTVTNTIALTGSAPQLTISNATASTIKLGSSGLAAPTFTSYSAGTKIVLFDNISGTSTGHAIGAETGNMWFTVSDTTNGYKWYGGTSQVATLSGTGTFTASIIEATNNGNGTNFKVGDDAYIGDINTVNTIRIKGVQNSANGYLVFGDSDTTALGRAGTGALTYGGNTIWHAGNDGASSGLDADTLDGNHASAFELAITTLSLTKGGTNASLTASNGGIVYSTASALAVLSGTATAGQILRSGSSAAPSWSTATYPATTTVNQILYSSSANVIGGITTANNQVLVTDGTGIPSFSATLPSGVTASSLTSLGTLTGLTVSGTGNNAVSITTGGTGAVTVATSATNSTSVSSGAISITTGNATGLTSNSGNITINPGSATGSVGTISIGSSNSLAITIGRTGATTTVNGTLTTPTLDLTTAATATSATSYFVETGSDGVVRPKTLANVKTEIMGNQFVVFSGPTVARTFTLPDSNATLMTNPMTTTGDVIYSSSGATAARLGIGTAGQALVVNTGATAPAWTTLTLENLPGAFTKKSVRVATTANITLSGTQTIDGVAVVAGDRVLVKDQTTTSANGIYVVAAGTWSRSADADTIDDIASALVAVDSGTANGGTLWDNDLKTTDTLGTTAMPWHKNIDSGSGITSGSTSTNTFLNYSGTTATTGQLDGGTSTPTGTTRLNYGGYLYATRLQSDTHSSATGAAANGSLFSDITTGTITIGSGLTTGSVTIGSALTSSTGTINIGTSSTSSFTVNIATGLNGSGATKTLNLGTGGVGGASNVNIGNTTGTTTITSGTLTASSASTITIGAGLSAITLGGTASDGSIVKIGRSTAVLTAAANYGVVLNDTANGNASIFSNTGTAALRVQRTDTTTTAVNAVEFGHTSTIGRITVTTTATAYVTSSDYRLKENVTKLENPIERLLLLKPSNFNFIVEPDKRVDGFLAHEVQEIVPEAVAGEKDEVDENGEPVYQGIDQAKLVPLLTAALQEAVSEINSLKARLDAAGL